jgi:hypothetical protein
MIMKLEQEMNDNIKAGADIHAGDGGYSEGTRESYEAFVKERNYSITKARIRMLAELASKDNADGYPVTLEYTNRFAERMTEEVIRECVRIIDGIAITPQDAWDDGYYGGCKDSAKTILEHFGVEK